METALDNSKPVVELAVVAEPPRVNPVDVLKGRRSPRFIKLLEGHVAAMEKIYA